MTPDSTVGDARVEDEVVWVDSPETARHMAERVLSPQRTRPIVGISTASGLTAPYVDPVSALAAVGGHAEVWALRGAREAWALSGLLPERLDVYGGALRVWWPVADPDEVNPGDHPLLLIYDADDADRVLRQLVARITRHHAPPPAEGTDTVGVVTHILGSGAHIRLAGDHDAFAALRHLANGDLVHAGDAVQPGQTVRVRVGAPAPGRRRVPVTLLPFAPDPWERLAEVYEPGMVVEGVVARIFDYGALVDVMPGACGMLLNRHIAEGVVDHPRQYFDDGDSVFVRIISIDRDERRMTLSAVDAVGEEPEPPASIYPDGPPWLAPIGDEDEDGVEGRGEGRGEGGGDTVGDAGGADAPPAPAPPEPEVELEADLGADPLVEPEPEVMVEPGVRSPAGGGADAGEDPGDDGGRADPDDPDDHVDAAPAGAEGRDTVEELRGLVDDARRVRDEIAGAHQDAARELSRLRSAANGLASELREEITAASLQIARQSGGRANALAAAEERVEEFRRTVADLRRGLDVAEEERASLIRAQARLEEQLSRTRDQVRREKTRADRQRQRADDLSEQLAHIDDGDPGRRFLRELHFTWASINALDADRQRYRFVPPTIGPAFLDSVQRTEGISHERLLEVCVHVVSGRAHEVSSLELHQMRTGASGNAPARVRESDGATAWRVSLQVKSHSARRLHFWRLPDGTVELSKIGVHDDLSII